MIISCNIVNYMIIRLACCEGHDRVYDIVLYHQLEPLRILWVNGCAKFAYVTMGLMETLVKTILCPSFFIVVLRLGTKCI